MEYDTDVIFFFSPEEERLNQPGEKANINSKRTVTMQLEMHMA